MENHNNNATSESTEKLAFTLWQRYPNFLSKCYWKHKIFGSNGYFACSIGEVSSANIQKYIESQG